MWGALAERSVRRRARLARDQHLRALPAARGRSPARVARRSRESVFARHLQALAMAETQQGSGFAMNAARSRGLRSNGLRRSSGPQQSRPRCKLRRLGQIELFCNWRDAMLVVTIDLVPGGFEPMRHTIASMRIANISERRRRYSRRRSIVGEHVEHCHATSRSAPALESARNAMAI